MSNIVLKRGATVKKTIFWVTLILIMLVAFMNINAAQLYYNDSYHDYEGGEIGLKINGKMLKNLPMQPVIIEDYTMVPVREVFEALGSSIIWHDDTCQVEIVDNGVSIFVKIGDRNTYINGELVKIEEPQPLPMLIGTDENVLKSMVPVRFIAEKLGFQVKWDNATRTVSIYEDENDISEIIGSTVPDEEEVIPEEKGVFGKVTAESDNRYDYIYISTRYGISPTVTRYKDPERIVFDFPSASFLSAGATLRLDGNSVDTVRYSNHTTHARLVLDISEKTQIMVMSSEKGIMIRSEKSENEAIIYDAFSKRVYFDKAYAGSGKAVSNGYSVTFTNLKLKNQKIEIHDGNIYEIIISNTLSGCTVTVDGSNKLRYTAEKGFYKADGNIENEKPTLPESDDGVKRVVIDAGHGGEDPGAVGYNSSGKAVAYESHINLAVALLVGEKLEAQGVEVIYTRNKDKYISLKDRSDLTNESGCDLFVSIHCNSIESAQINGTQVYYHPASEIGTVLAENIYDKMVEMTGLAPKETQNGSHLYVIRTTTCPAVLVETAFISNEKDRNYLLSKQGQETMSEAITQGIMETLGK